ncbi:MAG: hypothetical protein Q4P78_05320 [Rothia sp. (in: high G+C Gram-positive bacteria)]|uniref:hypothetical protein n=1 Tax=Rothia sp. (in: high G+C Gram-positive bacteria) TaxID=1885016 RepID=UPI0026DF1247|nr:hypothetical protein [Rothia sp. (in: high G+C Gram-positive bacteria)]MDO5750606.1 hypothetical protein [Rothia sp. (in: high G+C Gram-positive bacteria)]
MSVKDETTPTSTTAEDKKQVLSEVQEEETKAPWEENGEEFSPERAWKLIQGLRADNAKLKERLGAC